MAAVWRLNARASLALLVVAFFFSRGASAHPESRPSPWDCSGDYCHDGFYLRLSSGLNYSSFWGHGPMGGANLGGLGPSVELLVGGTPVPGLAVGGGFGFAGAGSEFYGARARGDGSMISPVLGAFVDWYLVPGGGANMGCLAGLGGFSGRDSAQNKYIGYAPAAALFMGYDFFVNRNGEVSAGFRLIAQGSLATNGRGEGADYRMASMTYGLQTSLLFH